MGTVIWLIVDSTVACCNPSHGDLVNICGCQCFTKGKWIMVLPMAIATVLRIILYIVLFGILADLMVDLDAEQALDNVFWIVLTYAAFDCGPMILITIDWWYYYSGSRNGLFGTSTNPMRSVVGQSAVLFIASWSFIAIFEEYADDAAEFIWPWILHGIISTAALVFCAVVQFSGAVEGNMLSTRCYQITSWILAAAMGIAVLLILIFVIELVVDVSDGGFPGWPIFIYFYYYTALSVPSVKAMASFKVNEQNKQMMEQEMGQSQETR